MAIHLRHVVKPGETLFDRGAHLVVLGRFHCSQRGDVRTAGMDFTHQGAGRVSSFRPLVAD
jgi:hypothetical protein